MSTHVYLKYMSILLQCNHCIIDVYVDRNKNNRK